METFKHIEGYIGNYEVSNKGTIKNANRDRVLKPWDNGNGYLYIKLGRRTTNVAIHRLVAKAFIPNPDNLKEVDHIDGNKYNNCVDNLRWVNRSDNAYHLWTLKDEKRDISYSFISPNGELFEVKNLTRFCKEQNLGRTYIRNVYQGKRPSYKGWVKA